MQMTLVTWTKLLIFFESFAKHTSSVCGITLFSRRTSRRFMHSPSSFARPLSPACFTLFITLDSTFPFSRIFRLIFLARAISNNSSHSIMSWIGFVHLWWPGRLRFDTFFELLAQLFLKPNIRSPLSVLGILCSISAVILCHLRSFGVLMTLLSSQPFSILLILSLADPTRKVSAQLSFLKLLVARSDGEHWLLLWDPLILFWASDLTLDARSRPRFELISRFSEQPLCPISEECMLSLSLHSHELVLFLLCFLSRITPLLEALNSCCFEKSCASNFGIFCDGKLWRLVCLAIPLAWALPLQDLWRRWCASSDILSTSSLLRGIFLVSLQRFHFLNAIITNPDAIPLTWSASFPKFAWEFTCIEFFINRKSKLSSSFSAIMSDYFFNINCLVIILRYTICFTLINIHLSLVNLY